VAKKRNATKAQKHEIPRKRVQDLKGKFSEL
jgi:hypothetical protein